MQAYQVQSDQGIGAIARIEIDTPTPGPGEVLVLIRANSLNYRDLGITRGGYFRNDRLPVIPLSDAAGEVVAVGDGTTEFAVGDRVAGTFFQDWLDGEITEKGLYSGLGGGIDGTLAEFVLFKEQGLVHIPNHLSYAEAATLPCAALTAWQALVTLGKLKAGDRVLLLGTGGVSIFGLQFAKAHGAEVIITSSSDEKLQRARQLGADHTINYKTTPDWENAVLDLTKGRGVDNVLEVGGPNTFEKSVKTVRPNGIVSLIGVLAGAEGKASPLLVVFNRLRVHGIYVGSRAMFQAMNRAIEQSDLHPIIDQHYRFDKAKEAYRALRAANHLGKIVISHS